MEESPKRELTEEQKLALELYPHAPHYYFALLEKGVEEMAGRKRNNKRIISYWKWVFNLDKSPTTDETPWCSAGENAMCGRAGIPGTGHSLARSWLKWVAGLVIGWDDVKEGDMMIFSSSRGSWAGHICHYKGKSLVPGMVKVYGPNQGNKWKVSRYPKKRVIGIRRWNGEFS